MKAAVTLNFVAFRIIMHCWSTGKLRYQRHTKYFPNYCQSSTDSILVQNLPIFQILWKATRNVLSYHIYQQTNRQTNKQRSKQNLPPNVSEVMISVSSDLGLWFYCRYSNNTFCCCIRTFNIHGWRSDSAELLCLPTRVINAGVRLIDWLQMTDLTAGFLLQLQQRLTWDEWAIWQLVVKFVLTFGH